MRVGAGSTLSQWERVSITLGPLDFAKSICTSLNGGHIPLKTGGEFVIEARLIGRREMRIGGARIGREKEPRVTDLQILQTETRIILAPVSARNSGR